MIERAAGPSPEISLDLRGLKCPLPVLRSRRALRRAAAGSVVAVACTDPLAAIDIPHFARQDGYELLSQGRDGDILTFWLRKPA